MKDIIQKQEENENHKSKFYKYSRRLDELKQSRESINNCLNEIMDYSANIAQKEFKLEIYKKS